METKLFVTTVALRNTASEFQTQAGNVKGITDDMLAKVAATTDAIEGNAAESFRSKFASLSDAMDTQHRQILEHVSDLNAIADEFDAKEQTNVELVDMLPVPDLSE